MTGAERAITAEELLAMPGLGSHVELVRGRLVDPGLAGGEHGEVHADLGARLRAHATKDQLGWIVLSTGFVLARGPDTVRVPDVAFLTAARVPNPMPRGFVELAPDLAVEVISPHDTYSELREKVEEYLEAGVREVWLVDPRRRRAEVFRAGAAPVVVGPDGTLSTDLLPGLVIPLAELF